LQIECQRCKTAYRFKEELPKDLVKVKCPKCSHFMIIESQKIATDTKKTMLKDEIFLTTLQEKINGLLLRIREKDGEIKRLRDTIKVKDEEIKKKEKQLIYKNEQLTNLQFRKKGVLSNIFSKKKKSTVQSEHTEFKEAEIERID